MPTPTKAIKPYVAQRFRAGGAQGRTGLDTTKRRIGVDLLVFDELDWRKAVRQENPSELLHRGRFALNAVGLVVDRISREAEEGGEIRHHGRIGGEQSALRRTVRKLESLGFQGSPV